MKLNRRRFINAGLLGGLAATSTYACKNDSTAQQFPTEEIRNRYEQLDQILTQPVLKRAE